MGLRDVVERYLEPGEAEDPPDLELDEVEDYDLSPQDYAHIGVMGALIHGSRPPTEQKRAARRKGYPDNAYTIGDLAVGIPASLTAYTVPVVLDMQSGGADFTAAFFASNIGKTLLDGGLRVAITTKSDGEPVPGLLSWKTAGMFAYDFGKSGLKNALPEEGARWVDRQDAKLQVGLDMLGDSIGDSLIGIRDGFTESMKMALSPEYRRLYDHHQPDSITDLSDDIQESYEEMRETPQV